MSINNVPDSPVPGVLGYETHGRQRLKIIKSCEQTPLVVHDIDNKTLGSLSKLGLLIEEVGVETVIEIQSFSAILNKALANNKSTRKNATEIQMIELGTNIIDAMFRGISKQAVGIATKQLRTLNAPGNRSFCGIIDDKIISYACFTPVFKEGSVKRYLATHLYNDQQFSNSIVRVILFAIETFRSEGVAELSLCLADERLYIDIEGLRQSKVYRATSPLDKSSTLVSVYLRNDKVGKRTGVRRRQ